jgi:hypothetical protein
MVKTREESQGSRDRIAGDMTTRIGPPGDRTARIGPPGDRTAGTGPQEQDSLTGCLEMSAYTGQNRPA